MAEKKPIIIREVRDGIGGQGPTTIWRAYGIHPETGKETWLLDRRYKVWYPLDESTEAKLRAQCARQYRGHPIIKKT